MPCHYGSSAESKTDLAVVVRLGGQAVHVVLLQLVCLGQRERQDHHCRGAHMKGQTRQKVSWRSAAPSGHQTMQTPSSLLCVHSSQVPARGWPWYGWQAVQGTSRSEQAEGSTCVEQPQGCEPVADLANDEERSSHLQPALEHELAKKCRQVRRQAWA